jgi:tetratricopeptide (TPR) repeat protein
MTEDKLQNLLRDTDDSFAAIQPDTQELLRSVRSRAVRRNYLKTSLSFAAAACLVIALCFTLLTVEKGKKTLSPQQLASLQQDIKRLNAAADATLKLVTEVIERQNKIENLQRLNAQLASYGDPLQEIKDKIDETAFVLVYNADRLYNELDQKEKAVESYKRVIEFFPDTTSAGLARQRLSEIQKTQINNHI